MDVNRAAAEARSAARLSLGDYTPFLSELELRLAIAELAVGAGKERLGLSVQDVMPPGQRGLNHPFRSCHQGEVTGDVTLLQNMGCRQSATPRQFDVRTHARWRSIENLPIAREQSSAAGTTVREQFHILPSLLMAALGMAPFAGTRVRRVRSMRAGTPQARPHPKGDPQKSIIRHQGEMPVVDRYTRH